MKAVIRMSRKYWRNRSIEVEEEWYNRCKETIEKQLADYYQKALSAIKDDILKLYGTFAKDNDLDFSEAKKLLNGNEFKTWRLVCCSSSALQVNRFAFHLR